MSSQTPAPAPPHGLSESEARRRFVVEGPNELPRPDRRTPFRIVLEVLREPTLALILGDRKEALILIALATFVNRSFRGSISAGIAKPNGALLRVLLAVVAMLATTLGWPWATTLLRFGPLHANDLAVTCGAGAVLFLLLEFLKPRWRAGLRA